MKYFFEEKAPLRYWYINWNTNLLFRVNLHIGFNRAISPRFLAKWKNLHLCLDEMLPSMKDLKMTFEYLDFAIALFNKTLRTLSYFGLGYE